MTSGGAGQVRVAIIGCGAIGSLYAAHLARVRGVEVWAVDPWTAHVDAIEARGLRVTGLAGFVARVRARADARDLPACDFGIVATKALDTRPSRPPRRPWPAPPSSACRTGSGTRRSSPA
jgi:2-dehydropantoate 2-reductase